MSTRKVRQRRQQRQRGGDSMVNAATSTWWGLADVGTWHFTDAKQEKKVTFSNDSKVSVDCLNTPVKECAAKPACRAVSSACLPAELSATWPSIGATINSKADGEPYVLTHFLKMRTKKREEYGIISVLENRKDNRAVVVFPSGYVKAKKKADILGHLIPDAEKKALRAKLIDLIKTRAMVVLCGHSMGCCMAQMFAVELIGQGLGSKKNLFVTGSGAYMWTCQPVVDMFSAVFAGRYQFFGSKLDVGQKLVDPFLLEGKIDGDAIAGFPTVLLDINEELPAEPFVASDSVAGAQMLHAWNVYKDLVATWLSAGANK